jgi:hypothetical protein
MANRPRHRRFGNIRKRDSDRHQVRYPGPDGRMRTGTETYARKSDAECALSLIEAQMISGEWIGSDRSKIRLQDYAAHSIIQRADLRPRTIDLYKWLCDKHINPYLGRVPLGWGEAIALRRCDLDLAAEIVRVRSAYSERVKWGAGPRTAEVACWPPYRWHPAVARPCAARASVRIRRPGAGSACLPRS